MKSWPNWYYDSNPFRVGGTFFGRILPAIVTAGAICMVGVLVAAILTAPGDTGMGDNYHEIVGSIFAILLYVIFGSFCAVFVGFFASLLISLFDYSIGKILSPSLFAAAVAGMSVIPVAIIGIFHQAFSTYPNSDLFVYLYFVSSIIVGCSCGIFGANSRIVVESANANTRWQLNIRQLFSVTGWVALILALGFGSLVLVEALIIYVVTVALVVIIYSQLRRIPYEQRQNGE